MTSNLVQPTAETDVRAVIEDWAKATRQNGKEDVLKNHVSDVVIFDVLPTHEIRKCRGLPPQLGGLAA